jgi:hypothetical protein
MQRLILVFLAVISLLLGVSAAIGSQPAPALADTTIPLYGAPDYVDGSPIGGGAGYLNIIDPSLARYVVSTGAELKSALASASSGDIVYVADGATITVDASNYYGTGYGCYVKAGVTLAGGRGRTGVTGGIIQLDPALRPTNYWFLILVDVGAEVCGLTIVGPQSTIEGGNNWGGVRCQASSEVHNNEIHSFGYAGVSVYYPATDAWIHHNYIHHCRGAGHGYGVEVSGRDIYHSASALVEGNVFDWHRHVVAGQRGRSSFIFRYNHLGANTNDHQIDLHGQNDGTAYLAKDGDEYIYCAGENIEIYNNTCIHVKGPDSPDGNGYPQAFVEIRGTPYSGGLISVHHNWAYVTSASWSWDYRVWQRMDQMPEYGYLANITLGRWVRMEVYDNWWGSTPPPSTNVAPVLNAIGNKSVNEGATLSFTISASDANGDALTYSASNLPVGATFDPATWTFTWTPSQSQAGVYTGVRFQVSDGLMTDYEDITITVSDGLQADVNSDGAVNSLDMIRVGQHWNETGESGWIPEDINKDGTVNVLDATLVGQNWTG